MRKKKEFSKVLLFWSGVVSLGLTVFCCLLAWRTGDTSLFAWLVPAVFAELATATGFYYAKAKAENEIKLKQKERAYDRSDPDCK